MNLTFLESIIDAADDMPIFRILSLAPYRNYYVVERADSVVMVCIYIHVCIHIYLCTCIDICMYIYASVYIYIFIHIYV
jgi:hypothetical protein